MKISSLGGSVTVDEHNKLLFQRWNIDMEGSSETVAWDDVKIEIILWLLRKAIAERNNSVTFDGFAESRLGAL